MKANELMIGDFVTFKDCQNDEEIAVIKIWHLSQEGNALVFIDDSKILDEIAIDDEIVGIHLTPEILEKNGFTDWADHSRTTRSCSMLVDKTNIIVQKIDGTDYIFTQIHRCGADSCEFRMDLKYVHELQHALKLCGIEKTIEL